MALINYDGFIGSTYKGQSVSVDGERCVNLYPEAAGPAGVTPEDAAYNYFGTPGLVPRINLGYPIIYAMVTGFYGGQWGWHQYFLAGNAGQLPYYIDVISGTSAVVSSIQLPGAVTVMPAFYKMVWNGSRMLILGFTSPGVPTVINNPSQVTAVWWANGNGNSGFFHQLNLQSGGGGFGPVDIALYDSYYLTLTNGVEYNNSIAASVQFDVTTWPALAYGSQLNEPDQLIAMEQDHEQLYVFGTTRTQIWYDAGTAPFPLAIYPGAVMEVGAVSPLAVTPIDNALAWVARDPRGTLIAYRNQGYVPIRISTHAVEWAWQQYTTTYDVNAYPMQWGGHSWWVVNFPTADATWVYDYATGQWFEWLSWDGTNYHMTLAKFHCFDPIAGLHLVGGGDSTGNVYAVSATTGTDNGNAIQRMRTAPHINEKGVRMFHHAFQIDTIMAAAIPFTLKFSNDGGFTWSSGISMTAGASGAGPSPSRARTTRLGSARNRVYSLTTTSPAAPMAWIGAYLDVTEGMG